MSMASVFTSRGQRRGTAVGSAGARLAATRRVGAAVRDGTAGSGATSSPLVMRTLYEASGQSEDLCAGVRDQHCVLELSRPSAVARHHGPAVRPDAVVDASQR